MIKTADLKEATYYLPIQKENEEHCCHFKAEFLVPNKKLRALAVD